MSVEQSNDYDEFEMEEIRLKASEKADKEREVAYLAVSKALATYRWWGFTNIVHTVRICITRIRLFLGMRMWP